jgi:hypothetical protein
MSLAPVSRPPMRRQGIFVGLHLSLHLTPALGYPIPKRIPHHERWIHARQVWARMAGVAVPAADGPIA